MGECKTGRNLLQVKRAKITLYTVVKFNHTYTVTMPVMFATITMRTLHMMMATQWTVTSLFTCCAITLTFVVVVCVGRIEYTIAAKLALHIVTVPV